MLTGQRVLFASSSTGGLDNPEMLADAVVGSRHDIDELHLDDINSVCGDNEEDHAEDLNDDEPVQVTAQRVRNLRSGAARRQRKKAAIQAGLQLQPRGRVPRDYKWDDRRGVWTHVVTGQARPPDATKLANARHRHAPGARKQKRQLAETADVVGLATSAKIAKQAHAPHVMCARYCRFYIGAESRKALIS